MIGFGKRGNFMDHLKESLTRLKRLNPPKPYEDDSDNPIIGILQQIIIEVELHLNRIDHELEYLVREVERLKESF